MFELGVQLPLEVEGVPRAQILEYGVVINRKPVKVMLDSGASVNAVAAEVVDRVGGVITPARERVALCGSARHPRRGVDPVGDEASGACFKGDVLDCATAGVGSDFGPTVVEGVEPVD